MEEKRKNSDGCWCCDIRGNQDAECLTETESGYICSIPHSWYATQLRSKISALEVEIKDLQNGPKLESVFATARRLETRR